MRIAIQGEPGSFSEQAALRLHPDAATVSCGSFAEQFATFRKGRADRALVPVENTLYGSVGEVLDLLLQTPGFVVAEIKLRIVHNLILPPGGDLRRVRRVLSHPVALLQCRRFLARHPQWQPIAAYDTAGSVKQLTEHPAAGAAAIASARAARLYGARIARRGIEDHRHNFTRFVLLAPEPAALGPGPTKISAVFALPNRPGALFKGLRALADEGINLIHIESRPVYGKPWQYRFFIDIDADLRQPPARRALRRLEKGCLDFRLLGAFTMHPKQNKNLNYSGRGLEKH